MNLLGNIKKLLNPYSSEVDLLDDELCFITFFDRNFYNEAVFSFLASKVSEKDIYKAYTEKISNAKGSLVMLFSLYSSLSRKLLRKPEVKFEFTFEGVRKEFEKRKLDNYYSKDFLKTELTIIKVDNNLKEILNYYKIRGAQIKEILDIPNGDYICCVDNTLFKVSRELKESKTLGEFKEIFLGNKKESIEDLLERLHQATIKARQILEESNHSVKCTLPRVLSSNIKESKEGFNQIEVKFDESRAKELFKKVIKECQQ